MASNDKGDAEIREDARSFLSVFEAFYVQYNFDGDIRGGLESFYTQLAVCGVDKLDPFPLIGNLAEADRIPGGRGDCAYPLASLRFDLLLRNMEIFLMNGTTLRALETAMGGRTVLTPSASTAQATSSRVVGPVDLREAIPRFRRSIKTLYRVYNFNDDILSGLESLFAQVEITGLGPHDLLERLETAAGGCPHGGNGDEAFPLRALYSELFSCHVNLNFENTILFRALLAVSRAPPADRLVAATDTTGMEPASTSNSNLRNSNHPISKRDGRFPR